ncbi:MAG: signal peptidase II [Gemmatimonadaceae bacterium]
MLELLVAGSVALFLDQWSKRLMELRARQGAVSVGSVMRIRHARNARELYSNDTVRIALVLLWLAALVSGTILHRTGALLQSHTAMVGLGAALGGAAGNLYDILRRRFIVDFIDFGWWPVFNLADIAIVCGLVLALWPQVGT